MSVQADREARLTLLRKGWFTKPERVAFHKALDALVAELEAVTAENTQLADAIEVLSGNDYLWRTGQIDAETAMEGNRACLAALSASEATKRETE